MKIPSVKIETPRLFIRAYEAADASALFRMVSNEHESLRHYFPLTVESNTSTMAAREFIKTRQREIKDGYSFFAGIFEKESGELIGQITLRDINWRVPKCELGYFIISEKRGSGIAPEALNAMSQFCFEKAGMVKLLLRIENINAASIAVARKCGYTLSGTLRNDFRSADGRLMDCEVWEKIM